MRIRSRIASLALLSVATSASPLHASSETLLAPLHVPQVASNDLLNNSYIVMFNDDVHPSAFESHMQFLSFANDVHPLHTEDAEEGTGVAHVYDSIVAKGYTGRFSNSAIEMIRRRPEVKYVEQDQLMRPDAMQVQADPTWGLARLNHRPQLHKDDMHYVFESYGGNGVLVYVIDTGVRTSHKEFGGRARWSTSFFPNEGYVDYNGHGTHVAGTIASNSFGVAKNAQIRAIKVFGAGDNEPSSTIIKAIEWAVMDAVAEARTNPDFFRGAVINMSLGGGRSRAIDDAADNAVRAGAHVVVSAGNANRSACEQSPAAAQLAITVGASRVNDHRATFSNWGRCVDLFAPGDEILSTWATNDEATRYKDGTSMSAAHVSGLVAYFLSIHPHWSFNPRFYRSDEQEQAMYEPRLFGKDEPAPLRPKDPGLTPLRLKRALLLLATRRKLVGVPYNTPNLLAYNNLTHQHIVPDVSPLEFSEDQWSEDVDFGFDEFEY